MRGSSVTCAQDFCLHLSRSLPIKKMIDHRSDVPELRSPLRSSGTLAQTRRHGLSSSLSKGPLGLRYDSG